MFEGLSAGFVVNNIEHNSGQSESFLFLFFTIYLQFHRHTFSSVLVLVLVLPEAHDPFHEWMWYTTGEPAAGC
jgi:hypothetical protein